MNKKHVFLRKFCKKFDKELEQNHWKIKQKHTGKPPDLTIWPPGIGPPKNTFKENSHSCGPCALFFPLQWTLRLPCFKKKRWENKKTCLLACGLIEYNEIAPARTPCFRCSTSSSKIFRPLKKPTVGSISFRRHSPLIAIWERTAGLESKPGMKILILSCGTWNSMRSPTWSLMCGGNIC